MTIGQLAQHLLALDPQKNQARLAFYHYLKNFLPLESALTSDVIDAFYDRALMFQQWQSQKQFLGETIGDDLRAIGARHSLGINSDGVVHANKMQIVALEQPRDFAALLAREVAKMEKQGEKVKSFRLSSEKTSMAQEIMWIRLQSTGHLIVEIRNNVAAIVDGDLQLLRPHSRLTYNADLDFEPDVDQFLMTSLMRVARFCATGHSGDKLRGSFIQGASFHRTETFEKSLPDVPELFQAIKKVERFYVNPVTDPYYHQLMKNFEQALNEKGI